MTDPILCPTCHRPLIGTVSGFVCEHCPGRVYPLPPEPKCYCRQTRNMTAKEKREAGRRRAAAEKRERSADWPAIRKAMGL